MSENRMMSPSLGTKLKLMVTADLGDGMHLGDVDFQAEFYSGLSPEKVVKMEKSDMTESDQDHYLAVVDTNLTGVGKLFMKLTAWVPDADVLDGLRTETVRVATNITVRP